MGVGSLVGVAVGICVRVGVGLGVMVGSGVDVLVGVGGCGVAVGMTTWVGWTGVGAVSSMVLLQATSSQPIRIRENKRNLCMGV